VNAPKKPVEAEVVATDDRAALQIVEDSLASLWSVVNTLSRIKPTRNERYRVTVFGSARIAPGEPIYEDVKRLTKALAAKGCDIVSGGGPGLMQAANEGAQLGDPLDLTRSIGIRIALPFEQGSNPFVEQVFTHETFYTRLHQFVRLSNAFVVMGGGIGTALETLMVWQLLQVRHISGVPLIFVGEMWAELVAWAKKHMLGGQYPLASPRDLDIPICVDTIDQALETLYPLIDEHAATNDITKGE
jgi:uncharacterized protein (TIGR00730 family)